MRISNLTPESARQGGTRSVNDDRPKTEGQSNPTVRTHSGDRVEISAAARVAVDNPSADGGLTPERIASLRGWLENGGHRDPAVIDQVARQIVDLGDLNAVEPE